MKPVFLVDDSPTMLASMSSVLGKAGIAVGKAMSGGDALERLKVAPPLRLMIVDFHMPGMNGVEPILMLTTESAQSKRDEARAAGATGWLVKPVLPERLLAVVQQVAPV
jgi:two-component system chemotaxis response regulator CheY